MRILLFRSALLAAALSLPAQAADFRLPPEGATSALPDAPRAVDPETLDILKMIDSDAMAATDLKEEDFYLDTLAATFGGDPIKAYDWVRTKTEFQPYSGVLRGGQRTLVARAGNAADRALLLAGLLKQMKIETRFATATLDDAAAAKLVDTAFGASAIPMSAPRGDVLDAAAMRAGRDFALLREAVKSEAEAALDTSLADATKAVREHVWVEAQIDGAWVALDPSADAAGATLATAATVSDALPDAAYQTVTLKIAATVIADGAVSVAEPLSVTVKAVNASAAATFLAFIQNPDEAGLGGAIGSVMGAGKTYVPVIWVDGEPFVGKVIPGLAPATEGSAADFLGGDDGAPKPELARLALTIETSAPDGVTTTSTRTLLDRAGAADAIAADTALTPMPMAETLPAPASMIHNIWISTGPVDLKNAYGLRALALNDIVTVFTDETKTKDMSPPDLLWPVAAFNAALPMALENSAIPGANSSSEVKVFTGRPRVTIFTRGGLDGPGGAAYHAAEVDLKQSGTIVLARAGAAKAAFETRVWLGVVEAALETEIGRRTGSLIFDSATTTQTSASWASDAPLLRIGAGGSALAADAPLEARTSSAAGHLIFAPDGTLVAWWDIDPASGTTKALLAPDLGGFRSYGGYRPDPSRSLDSSLTRARTGLQSNGGGNVTHISENGRTSIDYRGGRAVRTGGGGGAGGGGPPASRCGGGSEYMIIVGCVSLPAGFALRYAYAVVITEIVLIAADIILYLP
jgi:hypothetical protein